MRIRRRIGHVVKNMRNVFVFFQLFDQFFYFFPLCIGEFLGIIGDAFKLKTLDVIFGFLEILLDGTETGKMSINHHSVFVAENFLDAPIYQFQFKAFQIRFGLGEDAETAFAVEHKV